MNKRYVLKNRRRFYIFVVVLSTALSYVFFTASVNGADTNPAFTTVTVEKGDTLWDLAKEYSKDGDVRKYIHEVQKANNLENGDIYEGDVIKMPV